MDFTREPIVESIVTPREGHRIVVRSSKNVGHEEYFVDALEIVSFGNSVFFRSSERPKPFVVPAGDYEILEVREPRVVLKAPSISGTVKIGGQKEPTKEQPVARPSKEIKQAKEFVSQVEERMPVEEEEIVESFVKETVVPPIEKSVENVPEEASSTAPTEIRSQDRKKDRRGRFRKRRGAKEEGMPAVVAPVESTGVQNFEDSEKKDKPLVSHGGTLLPPPPTLIKDDIERLRKDDTFKGAFYIKEDKSEEKEDDDDDAPIIPERLGLDEDDNEEEIPPDAYKATPSVPLQREVREPFWAPPVNEGSIDPNKAQES